MNTARMLSLVQTIIDWDIPKIWDEQLGRNVPYSYKFGSNGEREYMRDVAIKLKMEILNQKLQEDKQNDPS